MHPSIVVAIITGITAISAALIQTVSVIRVAKINGLGTQSQPTRATIYSQISTKTYNQDWWWISAILAGTNFLWIIMLEWEAPSVIHLGAIPWCTCLLAYYRPLRWAYVAGIVTFVSLVAVLSFLLLGGSYSDSEISQLALMFVANSVLAAGIAYFRQR